MSTMATYVSEALPKSRRSRKTHAKVKTGCPTCKIRRKKCDETKPACLRCVNTGRQCDGYPIAPSSTSTASSTIDIDSIDHDMESHSLGYHDCIEEIPTNHTSPLVLHRGPSTVLFSNDVDYYCFDYFRCNTGAQIESYFDSTIFQNTTVRAGLSHPVVLKAAAAVGAVHQRFNHGISRKAFELCAISERLYREAAQSFLQFQRESTTLTTYRETSMVASMLLGFFEAFQGNYVKCVQHTEFGLYTLWNRPFKVIYSESRYRNDDLHPNLFFDISLQLHTLALHLFHTPAQTLSNTQPDHTTPSIPSSFASFEDARDTIFTEMDWILNVPLSLWHNTALRTQAQSIHVARLLRWSAAYANTISSRDDRTPEQRRACYLLKVVRDITYLLMYFVFTVPPPSPLTPDLTSITTTTSPPLLFTSPTLWNLITTTPDLSLKVTRINLFMETTFDPTSPFFYSSYSCSMDSGVGPPLYPSPLPDSSSKTRQILQARLRKQWKRNLDPDLWRDLGVYSIAERWAALEEHAVLAAARVLVPRGLEVTWVDVTCFIEERRVLVRYCAPDGLGDSGGLLWVQQWMEF